MSADRGTQCRRTGPCDGENETLAMRYDPAEGGLTTRNRMEPDSAEGERRVKIAKTPSYLLLCTAFLALRVREERRVL